MIGNIGIVRSGLSKNLFHFHVPFRKLRNRDVKNLFRRLLSAAVLALISSVFAPGISEAKTEDKSCSRLFKVDPEIEKNVFHTRRSYEGYLKAFEGILTREINSTKSLHFVDLGAGEGLFAETLARKTHHKVSMISFKVQRQLEEIQNLKIFKNVLFEDIPEETLIKAFGKFDVVIDYWGVLAYSPDPGATLSKLKNLCAEDCRIILQTEGSKFSKVSSLSNTKITMKNGTTVTLPEWLKQQSGLTVTDESGFLLIQFDNRKIFSPAKLEMIEYKSTEKVPGLFWGTKDEPRMPAARTFIEK